LRAPREDEPCLASCSEIMKEEARTCSGNAVESPVDETPECYSHSERDHRQRKPPLGRDEEHSHTCDVFDTRTQTNRPLSVPAEGRKLMTARRTTPDSTEKRMIKSAVKRVWTEECHPEGSMEGRDELSGPLVTQNSSVTPTKPGSGLLGYCNKVHLL